MTEFRTWLDGEEGAQYGAYKGIVVQLFLKSSLLYLFVWAGGRGGD